MPALTIHEIPADLVGRLRRSAEANHRTLDEEVIARLQQETRRGGVDPESFLAHLDRLHARTNPSPLNDEILEGARIRSR